MNESEKIQYWVVQLGNLYYAGGLARKKPEKAVFSQEFVSDESLSFPFIEKIIADKVAVKCGGKALLRQAAVREFMAMYEKREKYVNSEEEWHLEQETFSLLEKVNKFRISVKDGNQ